MKFRLIEFAIHKEGLDVWIRSKWDFRFERACTRDERIAIDRALDEVARLANPIVLRILHLGPGDVVRTTIGESLRAQDGKVTG
jgi:hypothetical protein